MQTQTHIQTNNIQLHVTQAGPEDGKLVILLHGFPEFWWGWRKQIDVLAEAGYLVWVPDQRGYNLSDKPGGLDAYTMDELSADIVGLMDAAGADKAIVVGHDWGAAVAWWLGMKHGDRVEKLAILNVPHPMVMRRKLRSSFAQLRKSWYMFFFQLPWLPEATIRAGNWRAGVKTVQGTALPGAFSDEDMEHYREAWSQPKAITGMINYYRALMQRDSEWLDDTRLHMPTLIIWGKQDAFLNVEMAHESLDLCDMARIEVIEDATHWVQHERAERVNELLLAFFAE